MQRKIGLLNFHHSTHNYGAVIQAAALEYQLKNEKETEVEIINFVPQRKYKWLRKFKSWLVRNGYLKGHQRHKIKNTEAFERFRIKFMKRSPLLKTKDEVAELSNNYSHIIVGSDQVWRESMSITPEVYFLDSVPSCVKRIAYAASFGNEKWEASRPEFTELVKFNLAHFSAISCRETSGVSICNSVFDVPAIHVLDPVLLVEDSFYGKIIENCNSDKRNRIVYYKLDKDYVFNSFVKSIETKYKQSARDIYKRQDDKDAYEEVDEWLSGIFHSEVVISDSYHCILLALRFNKKIFYYPNPARGAARFEDLVARLKLRLTPVDGMNYRNAFRIEKSPETDRLLSDLRQVSLRFLKNSLSI